MRALILLAGFLAYHCGYCQDLILTKNGDTIRARILEVGTEVVRYKKFDTRETSPVYELFKQEINEISYEDGSIDRFSAQNDRVESPAANSDEPTTLVSKLFLGGGFSLVNSYQMGNVLDFWRNVNSDNAEEIDQATGFFVIRAGMLNQLGQKSWIGMDAQVIITPSHALWGTNTFFGGRNEVYFNALLMNVTLSYSHAMDQKGNVLFTLEPGLDIGTMNGSITINNESYEQSLSFGLGGHGAVGLDFLIGKSMILNSRIGFRAISMDEVHEDSTSDTGYSSFYVNGTDGETVRVNWSGIYMTIGFSFAVNKTRG